MKDINTGTYPTMITPYHDDTQLTMRRSRISRTGT